MTEYEIPVRIVINGTAKISLPDDYSREEAEEVVRQMGSGYYTQNPIIRTPVDRGQYGVVVQPVETEVEVI